MPTDELRKGYDPQFLSASLELPMPTLSLELQDQLLVRGQLRDDYIADYIHYSVVMNRETKQAFFSAANLDQDDFKSVKGRRWFIDPRIGKENQIGNEAYRGNEWDRGHMTRRTAVTWGSTYEARRASNDSCSFANASLQHENFNQDEWRVPERIVEYFEKDKNNRISVFTGPLFSAYDRWFHQHGMDGAIRIPSAFWKVVAYIDKTSDELECQAYLMYQDAQFISDKRGQHSIDIVNYQVTISEIEKLTGLEFPQILFEANPLLYFSRDERSDGRTNLGPEAFEAPRSTRSSDLDEGVVFTRGSYEASRDAFDRRRRDIPMEDFVSHVEGGNISAYTPQQQ